MLEGLRQALARVFPPPCFLQGTAIREMGRAFSIKLGTGEAAIGLKLSPLSRNWPQGKGICDALFICADPQFDKLLVALVELKGGDIERAMVQIRDSCQLLCLSTQPLLDIHGQAVRNGVRSTGKNGHENGVLGVIVARNGLTLAQKERTQLWRNYRLRLWIRTGQLREVSCHDLAVRMMH